MKRYEFERMGGGYGSIQESSDGEYVKYSDIEGLIAAIKKANDLISIATTVEKKFKDTAAYYEYEQALKEVGL